MQKELKPPGFGLPWPVERDEGNVEYKWRLINVPPQRILRLATQMKFRLQEGCGTAWYLLGVMDNGLPRGLASTEIQESLRVLERVAEEANARIVEHVFLPGIEGSTVRVCITSVVVQELTIVETTVLVLGPPNVGKSSLVGVLSTGELDNGRGGALMRVIRHPHEFLQGRTTSTSTRTIGYNARGEPLTEYFGVSPDFPYVAQT